MREIHYPRIVEIVYQDLNGNDSSEQKTMSKD